MLSVLCTLDSQREEKTANAASLAGSLFTVQPNRDLSAVQRCWACTGNSAADLGLVSALNSHNYLMFVCSEPGGHVNRERATIKLAELIGPAELAVSACRLNFSLYLCPRSVQ